MTHETSSTSLSTKDANNLDSLYQEAEIIRSNFKSLISNNADQTALKTTASKAIEKYKAIITANPQHALAHLQTAKIHQHLSKFERAVRYYTKAIENSVPPNSLPNTDLFIAHFNRVNCIFGQLDKQQRKWEKVKDGIKNDYTKAVTLAGYALSDVLKEDVHSKKNLSALSIYCDLDFMRNFFKNYYSHEAKRAVAQKKYPEALEHINFLKEHFPKSSLGFSMHSHYCEALNDNDSAIKYLQTAIDIEPKNPRLLIQLGKLYENKGPTQYKNADACYDKALGIATPDIASEIWFHRGENMRMMREYEESQAMLTSAIITNDTNYMAYLSRGMVNIELDDHDAAIEDFSSVIALQPHQSSAYFYRGTAYEDLGDTQKAEDDYKKAAIYGNEDAKEKIKKFGGTFPRRKSLSGPPVHHYMFKDRSLNIMPNAQQNNTAKLKIKH